MAGGPDSIDEACSWLRKGFDAEAARDVHVAYAFELTGPEGGSLHARVDDGRLEVAPVALDVADVRFRLPARDFFAVLAGRENADLLFMSGRLEVEGDLALALKLRQLLRAAG